MRPAAIVAWSLLFVLLLTCPGLTQAVFVTVRWVVETDAARSVVLVAALAVTCLWMAMRPQPKRRRA
ncbi:hypothetical protein AB0B15_14265 [Streptomyces sp. NPDC045456]|uniref:hypothetical protein n=1 Tax=Streptomyces sp. NPDC045456 TaxID=3155254 RepID=UPI003401285F